MSYEHPDHPPKEVMHEYAERRTGQISGVPLGDYVTSVPIDNIAASEVGRLLDVIRNAGFEVEINVSIDHQARREAAE